MKKIFWKQVATIVCCFGFAWMTEATEPAKTVVGAEKVIEIEDFETRNYTGQVTSRSVVNIVPRVSGEILELGFKEGDLVRKGQVLYRLDSVQYEAAVKAAEADVEKYQAELLYAQNNYNRLNLLYQKQASSLDTMENARATQEVAKAALLAAEANLIAAKDNLKNTVITAPQDGIVGISSFTPGNYITPNSGTLLTIIQTQPVRIRFSISVTDLLEMFGNHKELIENGVVELKLANGAVFDEKGQIELLNNEANAKTDTVQIYATFPNAERKLIIGNTLSVTLSRRNGNRVPAVTPAALMHDVKGSYVYVLDSRNRVEKRYVKIGNATPEKQLIRSGLSAGEVVISKGTHKVVQGMTVEPEFEEE